MSVPWKDWDEETKTLIVLAIIANFVLTWMSILIMGIYLISHISGH